MKHKMKFMNNANTFCIVIYLISCYGLYSEHPMNYASLATFVLYSDNFNKSKHILNHCAFGRKQQLEHVLDLKYCYNHCSMRETCVAIGMEIDYCVFCYHANFTSNFDNVQDYENVFLRMSSLSKYSIYYPLSGHISKIKQLSNKLQESPFLNKYRDYSNCF